MKSTILGIFIGLTGSYAMASGVQTLSFEEFKTACANPSQFHNQAAPSNIQISCKDSQKRWILDPNHNIGLPASQNITTSLISDKYQVSEVCAAVKVDPTQMACPVFKQVIESVETVRSVTCEEILAYKGSPADLCYEALTALKAANPAAQVQADTGQSLDPCNQTEAQAQKATVHP